MVELPTTKYQCHNFIAGKWVAGNGETIAVNSPYDGSVIGQCVFSNAEDIDHAIKTSEAVFDAWASTPLKERTRIMFNFRAILLRDLDKITHIKCSESGKTFNEGRAGVLKGIEVLEYALSLQNKDLGGKMEVSRGVSCEFKRRPLGVVASITPFNFPAMVPLWTIPIALTLCNCYLWKPSEKTPLTSLFIANALKEAGLPDGVFTVVQGGEDCAKAIIDHPKVKAISFVGSTSIAKKVYSSAASTGKRVLALGGAKNHIVLLPDAHPELTAVGISNSFTGCAGQRCMAASVLLAVGEVDSLIDKIKGHARSLKLGETMGAIVTAEQRDFLIQTIEKIKKEDTAEIVLDGTTFKPPAKMSDGYWLGPTIIDHIKPNSELHTTELFGPILVIIRCRDISEAMEIENSIAYGNACSVFTQNGALAEKVANAARAGMVGINVGVPVPREPFSFGGIDDSKFGHGDITGDHSLNFWSDLKKVTTKWEPQSDHNWMS